MSITIALDAMGGDAAPKMVIEGAVRAAAKLPNVEFLLVGKSENIRHAMPHLTRDGSLDLFRYRICEASQVVDMDEKPSIALRAKKDSSMRVAANLVKSGEADAFVSAGNTGALMAIAKYVLKTLPGIDRPAIASLLPSVRGSTLMLDLGANLTCTVDHLCQFALMGEVFAETLLNLKRPRIGLLNIGSEAMKGHEVIREAGERLRHSHLNMVGNVEGTDIFLGDVDVVVCDGFIGNISLKTGEGVAQMLTHFLKEAFANSFLAKLGYLLARPAMKRFQSHVDPRRYNGAMLLGLNGVVVKSHGSADDFAYANAIHVATGLAENRVSLKIQEGVSKINRIRQAENRGETAL